jgi:dienelactone hydrolase
VYAAQLADLASHGYVVAAITHPYDGLVAAYHDGHTAQYDAKRWPQIPSFEGEWNLNQLDWHARDIRFVLDQLHDTARTAASALPFANHLDLTRVGAFGHSFGGVAAAKACQTDHRISACLNEDGLAGRRPFDTNGGSWSRTQRFMLLQIGDDPGPPPDDELAKMRITREQVTDLIARLTRDHDAALRLPGSSYEVVLGRTKSAHMDFTDLPILGAKTSEEAVARTLVISTVRGFALAFFEEALRGKRSALLGARPSPPLVQSIRRF